MYKYEKIEYDNNLPTKLHDFFVENSSGVPEATPSDAETDTLTRPMTIKAQIKQLKTFFIILPFLSLSYNFII